MSDGLVRIGPTTSTTIAASFAASPFTLASIDLCERERHHGAAAANLNALGWRQAIFRDVHVDRPDTNSEAVSHFGRAEQRMTVGCLAAG